MGVVVVADRVHIQLGRDASVDGLEEPQDRRGKTKPTRVIDTVRTCVPDGLDELAQLGRTLHRRRSDVLAYFDYRVSNGPTKAINGRLEALRRRALGFRNLTHYWIRSLLHCGNLTPRDRCTLEPEDPLNGDALGRRRNLRAVDLPQIVRCEALCP